MTRSFNKVFGIGLSRTGTTSLDAALWHLGLESAHNPSPAAMIHGDFRALEALDAGTDISVASVFKALDKSFPNSKFVLTVRDPMQWLQSAINHISNIPTQLDAGESGALRLHTYGAVRPTPDQLLAAYRAHISAVSEYFADRPKDWIVMDVTNGDGWERLCPFLKLEQPKIDFPNTNSSSGTQGVGYPESALDKKQSAQEIMNAFKPYAA